MMIAERLCLDGLQEGLQRGKREAVLCIAQTTLEQGIDRNMMLLVTGLSEEELIASHT